MSKFIRQRKKLTIIIILIFIIFVGLLVFDLYGKYQISKIAKMSSNEMICYTTKEKKNAIITVGIIKDGQVSYSVYGENGVELTNELHVYEIGSLTKTFTAAMICQAIEDGKIELNSSVDKYLNLPNGDSYPTIKQLLTHTSGYKAYYLERPMISNFISAKNDFYGITREMIRDKIGSLSVSKKPFEYSNFGYAVLGLVLENVYNQDYKVLLNDFAQNELGLENTKISDKTGDLENYWDWNDDDAYLPVGAITSNIEDMLLYTQIQLSHDKIFNECHRSLENINVTSEGYNVLQININEIGMAWLIDNENNIIWHNGGTDEYNSYLGFNSECETAVVILSNLSPNYKVSATVLGVKILQEIKN